MSLTKADSYKNNREKEKRKRKKKHSVPSEDGSGGSDYCTDCCLDRIFRISED